MLSEVIGAIDDAETDPEVGVLVITGERSFVDLGIIPGDGGAWLLPRAIGWQRAAELAFTGRTVDAAEASELGILLEVTCREQLLPRARALADLIAG